MSGWKWYNYHCMYFCRGLNVFIAKVVLAEVFLRLMGCGLISCNLQSLTHIGNMNNIRRYLA